MIPGGDIYYACPICKNIISKGSLISGNTFGAKHYSDNKTIAPMLPKYPEITKCKKCDNIFWLDEEMVISEPDNREADVAQFLSIDDYIKVLDSILYSSNDEQIYIRHHLWWKFNDRVRVGKQLFLNENDEEKWKQNLIKLENILNLDDDNNILLAVEINRSLGNFDKCRKLLYKVDNPELCWVTKKLKKEVELENRYVCLLNDKE